MKKIYSLILLAAAALSANAQVVLTYNGETVDPSKELRIDAEVVIEHYLDWEFDDERVECGNHEPKLLNQGSSAVNVEVTAAFDNLNIGIQWCFPRDCTYLQKSTESRSSILAANEVKALLLEPAFTFGEYGSTKCKLTIKAGNISTTYNLNFVYDEKSPLAEYNVYEDTTKDYDDPDRYIYELISSIQSVTNVATDSSITDLQGRRVAQPQAGQLYIKGGRKFIQK